MIAFESWADEPTFPPKIPPYILANIFARQVPAAWARMARNETFPLGKNMADDLRKQFGRKAIAVLAILEFLEESEKEHWKKGK